MIMAIRPVSSVSFNNYNVGFEGKKHKTPENRHSSNPIKAIPLAALIAMSPMALAEDAFSLEPQETRIENIYGPEQSRVVPLPSNCKILKEVRIDKSSGGYEQFGLIDTNGDGSNFEILEYRDVGSSGRIIDRGILCGVYVSNGSESGKYGVRLLGIQLNTNNIDDYSPQNGMFRNFIPNVEKEIADFYYSLTQLRENNGAVWSIDNLPDYGTKPYYYKQDMAKYKKILGIDY